MGCILIWDGSSNLQLVGDAQRTLKGPYRQGASLAFGCVVWRFVASSKTRLSLWKTCDSIGGPRLHISCAATVRVTHFQHVSGRLSNESLAEWLKSGKESG